MVTSPIYSSTVNSFASQSSERETADSRIHWALRALHRWHLASLDAPCVAVVWTAALGAVTGVSLKPWIFALIACGTWGVYVADRLLDAYRAMRNGALEDLRERHYFHWRHRRWLIAGACAAAAIAVLLIINRMSSAARHRDSLLAAAALLYFSGVHSSATLPRSLRKLASKEFLVGVLFTAGCAAPSLVRLHAVTLPLIIALVALAMLAWLNCFAIATWESAEARTGLSVRLFVFGIACFAAAAALSLADPRASQLIAAAGVSSLLLALLDRARYRMAAITLRSLADLMLLTPLIIVISLHI